MKRFAKEIGVHYLAENTSHEEWLFEVQGFENEQEGGRRCAVCIKMRIEKTGRVAIAEGFDAFTTTLTVSPHKNARFINESGFEISQQTGVPFLERDFKKRDGFKNACELANEAGLYRQNYCGCEFGFGRNRE